MIMIITSATIIPTSPATNIATTIATVNIEDDDVYIPKQNK